MKRLVLQEALAAKAPRHLVEFNKKLVGLKDLGKDGVRVSFEDGSETVVDLVVGADGIRSVCLLHPSLAATMLKPSRKFGRIMTDVVGAGGEAAHHPGLPPGIRM